MNWKQIEGYSPCYEVSETAEVREKVGDRYIDIPKNLAPNGYYRVPISHQGIRKYVYVHRLVGIAHVPNPDKKPHINHKDSNRANSVSTNLEWVTPKENHTHAVNNGRILCKGSSHPAAKLSDEDVEKIKKHLSERKLFLYQIGELFGVSQTAIGYIYRNARSGAFSDKTVPKYCARIPVGEEASGCKYSDEKIREVRETYSKVKSIYKTAKICGVSKTLVDAINHGHRSEA